MQNGYSLRDVMDKMDELSCQRLTSALNAVYGNIYEAEQRLGSVEDIEEVFEQTQQAFYMAEAG